MDSENLRRRWYQTRRGRLAALAGWIVLYLFSRGPAEYAVIRGWLPVGASEAFYFPADIVGWGTGDLGRAYREYVGRWALAGRESVP